VTYGVTMSLTGKGN